MPRERPETPIRSAEDAESAACAWLRHFGFEDAQVTSAGADGGVDVVSADLVVQVKAQAVPVGRPIVQQIHGIASLESKEAAVFSLAGFTEEAIEWASEAGVALVVFNLLGEPEPLNAPAHSMMNRRAPQATRDAAAFDELIAPLPTSSSPFGGLSRGEYLGVTWSDRPVEQLVGFMTNMADTGWIVVLGPAGWRPDNRCEWRVWVYEGAGGGAEWRWRPKDDPTDHSECFEPDGATFSIGNSTARAVITLDGIEKSLLAAAGQETVNFGQSPGAWASIDYLDTDSWDREYASRDYRMGANDLVNILEHAGTPITDFRYKLLAHDL